MAQKKKSSGKKSPNKKSSKKKNQPEFKDVLKSPKILVPAIILLVFISAALIMNSLDMKKFQNIDGIQIPEKESIEINQLSSEAFDYLNEFRTSSNLDELEFSENAYIVALEMSRQKEYDESIFRRTEDMAEFMRVTGKLTNYTTKYSAQYPIENTTVQDFENSFNDLYPIKTTIRQDKYTAGAVGCSENYCTMILLGTEDIDLDKYSDIVN